MPNNDESKFKKTAIDKLERHLFPTVQPLDQKSTMIEPLSIKQTPMTPLMSSSIKHTPLK